MSIKLCFTDSFYSEKHCLLIHMTVLKDFRMNEKYFKLNIVIDQIVYRDLCFLKERFNV